MEIWVYFKIINIQKKATSISEFFPSDIDECSSSLCRGCAKRDHESKFSYFAEKIHLFLDTYIYTHEGKCPRIARIVPGPNPAAVLLIYLYKCFS